jgi:hypothetical protein
MPLAAAVETALCQKSLSAGLAISNLIYSYKKLINSFEMGVPILVPSAVD